MRERWSPRLPARSGAFAAAAALLGAMVVPTLAAQPATDEAGATAFVDVNVVAMDSEGVQAAQTVIVRGDRIVAMGARDAVPLPGGAQIVRGNGRYLVPGLTDGHVHLATDMPWAPARPDFGDAPLYLAHGVTTVINLRGTPEQLEWRRRVEAGELAGPTIYTAGEFVNEPRVNTPDEAAREIAAQRRAGYDVIKFHEVWTRERGFLTTTGLSRASYLRMNDAARQLRIPLVGHAPVNLDLDALLQARQPLAHLGMLSNMHFLPVARSRPWLVLTTASVGTIVVLAVLNGIAAVARRWRSRERPSLALIRMRRLTALQLLVTVLSLATAVSFLPGGPLFDTFALRLVFTSLVVVMAGAAVALSGVTTTLWREPGAPRGARAHAFLASVASLVLVCTAFAFWVPLAYRSTASGIERLAKRLRAAGIPVQTTLVAYDAIGGPGRDHLVNDPAVQHLRADLRARWRRVAQAPGPPAYRYTDFMRKVAGTLHRTGVPLIAGTDAMGLALIAPGSSLHRELELLVESGLTPYDALRAATSAPARFLAKEREFGTVRVGARADLLLVEGNPLQDIGRLRKPIGVMARGRWYTREQLQRMLDALRQES